MFPIMSYSPEGVGQETPVGGGVRVAWDVKRSSRTRAKVQAAGGPEQVAQLRFSTSVEPTGERNLATDTELLARFGDGRESHPAPRRDHSDPISPIRVVQQTDPMHAHLLPADVMVVTELTVVAARDDELVYRPAGKRACSVRTNETDLAV